MKKIARIFLLAFLCGMVRSSFAQVTTTYAGDTTDGYSGDGGPAIYARLGEPTSVAIDANGNLYIVDRSNNCVRKVDSNGIISTFAGTGVAGYNGNYIRADSAQLSMPNSIAVDDFGNVYISDAGGTTIRVVDAAGMISTVYSASSYPTSASVQAMVIDPLGHLFFSGDYSLYELDGYPFALPAYGGAVGLMGIYGLACDTSGNIYVGNSAGSRAQILKIDTGYTYTPLAGDGACGGTSCDTNRFTAFGVGLGPIVGIARDDSGNIYYGEEGFNLIFKLDKFGNIVTYAGNCTVWGHTNDGGQATSASLEMGSAGIDAFNAIAIDKKGNLYVAEPQYHSVRKIWKDGVAHHTANVSNNSSSTKISVNPNPASNIVNVMVHSINEEEVDVSIVNLLGQQMYQSKVITNRSVPIEIDLPSGAYRVFTHTKKAVESCSLVIAR